MQKTKEKKLKNKYWKKKRKIEKTQKVPNKFKKKTYSKQNKDLSKNISIVLWNNLRSVNCHQFSDWWEPVHLNTKAHKI